MPNYNPQAIEPRWQRFWQEHRTFATPDSSEKPKYYILDMFPYPSGAGLHVGHPEGYTATDILARYRRMTGHHVLHPMGWDAFGLPAEQYAIQTGTHPRVTTQQNIATFQRQIQRLGFSYDWDREVDTTDPEYLKWTQWIFLQIFDTWYDPEQNKGRPISELPIPPEVRAQGEAAVRRYQDAQRLAYESEVPVWWCPALGTVLANEEVIDGKSERGNHPCERRPLRQWMLRITAYADRLLDDLDLVDWPESIKKMQRELDRPERRARRSISSIVRAQIAASMPCESSRLDRHALRRHVHGAVAGASAGRSDHDAGAEGRRRRVQGRGRQEERPGAHRAGQEEDRRLHRRLRDQPGQRGNRSRSGSPTTCWPATAPARSWPCRARRARL